MSKIAVIGTGYVGLTTAVGLANLGHEVVGYDLNNEKIDLLKAGQVPFFEPGLDLLLVSNLDTGKLTFTSKLIQALTEAEFIFICVPTPQDEDGSADLSYVIDAATAMRSYLQPNSVVITKSTVPVGSAKRVEIALNRDDVRVASNPEFLREGTAVLDFNKPDRIVIGARDEVTAQRAMELYRSIECTKIITSQNAAELIKYASNSFLAVKLSFVNDLAALCRASDAPEEDVLYGMGTDSRIGNRFTQPGPGWGGSCFPKDTRALNSIAQDFGMTMPIVEAAIASNERAHKRVVDRILKSVGGALEGSKIAVWGLTFKADTDDLRESPAISVISRLIDRGAEIVAYDPQVEELPAFPQVSIALSEEDALIGCDALVVLTEWRQFANPNLASALKSMNATSIVDTRSILPKETWAESGAIFY